MNNNNKSYKRDSSSHNFNFQFNSEFNPNDAHILSNDFHINFNQNNSFIDLTNLYNINKNSNNTSVNYIFSILLSGNDGDGSFPNT